VLYYFPVITVKLLYRVRVRLGFYSIRHSITFYNHLTHKLLRSNL